MAMPLDIPWIAGVWADQPGFDPPADGSLLIANPTGFAGKTVNRDTVRWSDNIGGRVKPSFFFEKATHKFTITPTYTDPNVITVVIVGQMTSAQGGDLFDGPAGNRHLIDSAGGVWRTFSGTGVISGGTADNNMHLFILESLVAGNDYLTVDGVTVFTGDSGTNPGGVVVIGDAGNGDHFGSKVAFCGVIDRVLTTQERTDLWEWYKAEYRDYSTFTKRDQLLVSTAGTGSVSDRILAQERAAYAGSDPSGPLTINDYLVANGKDKNIIQ